MSDLVFVDTNVFVYLRDSTEPQKQRRAAEWVAYLWESRRGRVSVQVLQEYYVTTTKKLDPGLTHEEAREDIAALAAGWDARTSDLASIEHAWRVQDLYGFSFWDAMVVASAHRMGCSILLTEDLQDGQRLDDLVVRSPFTTPPPR